MFERLKHVFKRYVDARKLLKRPGWPMHDETGKLIGNIDLLRLEGGAVILEGWTIASKITVTLAGATRHIAPNLVRSDVHALGHDFVRSARGFAISLPASSGMIHTLLEYAGTRYCFARTGLTSADIRHAKLAQIPAFLWSTLAALPAFAMWRMTGSAQHRSQVQRKLGLYSGGVGEDPVLYVGQGVCISKCEDVPITIIMPIFNAFDDLRTSLTRVAQNTDLEWSMIVVEDCSTDPRVRSWVEDWAATQNRRYPGQVTLLKNRENLGFIASVNRALKEAIPRGHHVVLLNSDAFVPADWASRLLGPIVADKNVASVTPLSNNAELLTVPHACAPQELRQGQVDIIDADIRLSAAPPIPIEMPTGVGFCMAMNIHFLRQLPQLDLAFGRGYGEEVDWCLRASQKGGKHIAQTRLFVEHAGGASFGSEAKKMLIARNNQRLSARYPQFDSAVQHFLRKDPLCAARIAAGLAMMQSSVEQPLNIYLAHSLGGGAEMYLKQRLTHDLRTRGGAVVVRVGGTAPWRLELHLPDGVVLGTSDTFEAVGTLLANVAFPHVVYSCGVGAHEPNALPDQLRKLSARGTLEVLFHDYYPLSPGYTLLNSDGYHQRDSVCLSMDDSESTMPSLESWRAAWGGLLEQAQHLTVFSQSSADLVGQAYPKAAQRIRVRAHDLLAPIPKVPMPLGGSGKIGFLGNLNFHKGAGIACELARMMRDPTDRKMVLLGNLAPEFLAPPNLHVHGSYDISELATLARRYDICAWIIPSIWPETFSYTTHEALATGLPTHVFDLGAQAEAARAMPNGHLIPYGTHAAMVRALKESFFSGECRDVA